MQVGKTSDIAIQDVHQKAAERQEIAGVSLSPQALL